MNLLVNVERIPTPLLYGETLHKRLENIRFVGDGYQSALGGYPFEVYPYQDITYFGIDRVA